jgi:WD40 repeat protein
MRNQGPDVSRGGNVSRRLSLLGAVLVAVLLVGGLAAILNLSRQKSATGTSVVPAKNSPTATSTPAPVLGKTLYTTPANQWGFESLSWSPNSKRVASATGGVQFWDATTGAHLVTVQLPGGTNEWANGLDWSPNSEDVAVATSQHILIVDGQTGKVINTYAANVPTASNATSSGQTFLSSLFPASGGYGFRATTWSPDGHYIAATTWNTQPTDLTQPSSMEVVWNVSTHQMVFHHSDFMSSNAPAAWQPQSHNLAFVGATSSGGNLITTLEIWDATTGKLVKQYVGAGTGIGPLAWSPDGTYLAYAGYSRKDTEKPVIIMDAITGKQIYIYNGHHLSVSVIAWSPNGKYIVSAEGNTEGQMVAEVWTA